MIGCSVLSNFTTILYRPILRSSTIYACKTLISKDRHKNFLGLGEHLSAEISNVVLAYVCLNIILAFQIQQSFKQITYNL